MDYKTKRTVLSSAVLVSSLIVCLVCSVVLMNTLGDGRQSLPENTEAPTTATPTLSVSVPPVTTAPTTTSNATPTQTYENPPYTTGAQTTKTPDVTISVTTPPPVTEEPIVGDPSLTYFQTKLRSFNSTSAVYEVTLRFNAGGHVKLVAINSSYGFSTGDINPAFVRDVINGKYREYLSTPYSFTSNIATENTNLTLTIQTGLEPVDFFVIIDTDPENGLMGESVVQKNQGFLLPAISSCTTPTVKDGRLTFDIQLTGDLPEGAKVQVTYAGGTMESTTTNGKATFVAEYNEQFSNGSMTARIYCQGVAGSDVITLPAIEIVDVPVEDVPEESQNEITE